MMPTATSEPARRTKPQTTAALHELLQRIEGEYREMPAMRLTFDQAMRLWNIDRQTCATVLNSLIASRYLEIDGFGRYRKAHSGY